MKKILQVLIMSFLIGLTYNLELPTANAVAPTSDLPGVDWGVANGSGLYSIDNIEELYSMRYHSSSGFILINDLDFTNGLSYANSGLTGLDYNNDGSSVETIIEQFTTGVGWLPIGHDTTSADWFLGTIFQGDFYGNGYSISNLLIDRNEDYIGLFGAISGSIINNIHLKNVNITSNGKDVGGLAGTIGRDSSNNKSTAPISTITNSSVEGSVTGIDRVGGMAGSAVSADFYDSYTKGSVTGNIAVGGFVGSLSGYRSTNNSFSTSNVYATGNYIGGFVGSLLYATIVNSYATGHVYGETRVGGFVGASTSSTAASIHNSYSTGDVNATGSEVYAGGFIGYAGNHEIYNSFTTGNVTGVSDEGYVQAFTYKTLTGKSNYGFSEQKVNGVKISTLPFGVTVATVAEISSGLWMSNLLNVNSGVGMWNFDVTTNSGLLPVLYQYNNLSSEVIEQQGTSVDSLSWSVSDVTLNSTTEELEFTLYGSNFNSQSEYSYIINGSGVSLTGSGLISDPSAAAIGGLEISGIDILTLPQGNTEVTLSLSSGLLEKTFGTYTLFRDAKPTVSSVESYDLDASGDVDTLKVTYSEAVSDASLVVGNFGNYTVTGLNTTPVGYTDTANDNIHWLSVSGLSGTDITSGLTITTLGAIQDTTANNIAVDLSGIVTTDKALPVFINMSSGLTYTGVDISLSESGVVTYSGITGIDNTSGVLSVNSGLTDGGTYIISATDGSGNLTSILVYILHDDISPVLALSGISPVNMEAGYIYTEAGVAVTDNTFSGVVALDTHLEESSGITLSIESDLDIYTSGVYTITYTASDLAGNTHSGFRSVVVTDTQNPSLELIGSGIQYISQNSGVSNLYAESGITATDNSFSGVVTLTSGFLNQSGLTLVISGVSDIDEETLGNYTITYTVTDETDHVATTTRTVTVIDDVSPLLTVTELTSGISNSHTVEVEVLEINSYVQSYQWTDSGVAPLSGSGIWTVFTGSGITSTSGNGTLYVHIKVIDVGGNEVINSSSGLLFDTTEISLTSGLGVGTVDFVLDNTSGVINFGENLTASGIEAVELALTRTNITLEWQTSGIVVITSSGLITFADDITVQLTDEAGNVSNLILIDSHLYIAPPPTSSGGSSSSSVSSSSKITLSENVITIFTGDDFTLPSYTAIYTRGSATTNIIDSVTVTGEVDNLTSGIYTITVQVSYNNRSDSKVITVIVLDKDTDGDGATDIEERVAGSNENNSESTPADLDGDGATNVDEIAAGSDSTDNTSTPSDIDGDGYSNDQEIENGSNPTDSKSNPMDIDGNGILDLNEIDTDGDGFVDVLEIEEGTDPYDFNSNSGENQNVETIQANIVIAGFSIKIDVSEEYDLESLIVRYIIDNVKPDPSDPRWKLLELVGNEGELMNNDKLFILLSDDLGHADVQDFSNEYTHVLLLGKDDIVIEIDKVYVAIDENIVEIIATPISLEDVDVEMQTNGKSIEKLELQEKHKVLNNDRIKFINKVDEVTSKKFVIFDMSNEQEYDYMTVQYRLTGTSTILMIQVNAANWQTLTILKGESKFIEILENEEYEFSTTLNVDSEEDLIAASDFIVSNSGDMFMLNIIEENTFSLYWLLLLIPVAVAIYWRYRKKA